VSELQKPQIPPSTWFPDTEPDAYDRVIVPELKAASPPAAPSTAICVTGPVA